MSRRRRQRESKSYTYSTLKRDAFVVASTPAVLLQRALSPVLSPITETANLLDDWRTWSPEPRTRRPKTFSGSSPVIKSSRTATPFGYADFFAAPQAVVRCVRRKARREIMHALKKAGKRGPKGRYRRNLWSGVHC